MGNKCFSQFKGVNDKKQSESEMKGLKSPNPTENLMYFDVEYFIGHCWQFIITYVQEHTDLKFIQFDNDKIPFLLNKRFLNSPKSRHTAMLFIASFWNHHEENEIWNKTESVDSGLSDNLHYFIYRPL